MALISSVRRHRQAPHRLFWYHQPQLPSVPLLCVSPLIPPFVLLLYVCVQALVSAALSTLTCGVSPDNELISPPIICGFSSPFHKHVTAAQLQP